MFAPQRTIILEFLSHILLGADLERARQAHAEAAEPPADHCGMPVLSAVDIGEPLHQLDRDRTTRRKTAMSCPQAHSFGSDCLHPLHDEIQRLVPTKRRQVFDRRSSRIWGYSTRLALPKISLVL